MTLSGENKADCDTDAGKTWLDFPNAGGVSWTVIPAHTSLQSFKPVGDGDNPGCFVHDVIGEPVTATSHPIDCSVPDPPADTSGAAALAPAAAAASVAIAAAVGSALMA